MQEYLNNSAVKKLQLGAGGNILQGWLNTDYQPMTSAVHQLDASTRFPFEDNTFDYVYSEHMIEHLSFAQGQVMLSETYRVLKPGGRFRLTCPDFEFLIRMYKEPSGMSSSYVNWATGDIKWAPYADPIFVINNYVRDWGHQFIYDKYVMMNCLQAAGFADITEHHLLESNDENLKNLEVTWRMPPNFLQLESMTFECIKQ